MKLFKTIYAMNFFWYPAVVLVASPVAFENVLSYHRFEAKKVKRDESGVSPKQS